MLLRNLIARFTPPFCVEQVLDAAKEKGNTPSGRGKSILRRRLLFRYPAADIAPWDSLARHRSRLFRLAPAL